MDFSKSNDQDDYMEERMKYTRDYKTKGYKANSRGRFIQQPFTTLEEMFRKVPEGVGFNIEMKYAMLHESEEHNMDAYAVELNSFVDTVLTTVYDNLEKDAKAGRSGRNIMFSSFNPDVCLLLSFKQPNFPILFLTDAGTASVSDVRASSLQEAVRFASRWNLLGVVSQAEPFCVAPRLVRVVKGMGLVCVSYGAQNNDPVRVGVSFLFGFRRSRGTGLIICVATSQRGHRRRDRGLRPRDPQGAPASLQQRREGKQSS
jgi:glycerophosphodiester phosphodiesterase